MHLDPSYHHPLTLACEHLLQKLGLPYDILRIERFCDEALSKTYDTYLVTTKSQRQFIVKRTAQTQEREIYTKVLLDPIFSIPKYYGDLSQREGTSQILYMLMEYIPGDDLRSAALEDWIEAVKSLATIHRHFLNTPPPATFDFNFHHKLKLLNRDYRALLSMPQVPFKKFTKVYASYIERFLTAPRTLVNNDLLPINILTSAHKTYLIDWSHAHYSPYMLDMARLTCHHDDHLDWFIPECHHEYLEHTYYDEMKKHTAFDLSYGQYHTDLLLAKFKESVSYIVWCIRNPNAELNQAFYDQDFSYCERLTQALLP